MFELDMKNINLKQKYDFFVKVNGEHGMHVVMTLARSADIDCFPTEYFLNIVEFQTFAALDSKRSNREKPM